MDKKIPLPSRVYEFQEEKLFTDCTLRYENQDYQAHRIILSLKSQYFKNQFPQNAANQPQVISLPFNNQNIIVDVLKFIYSQPIKISFKNVVLLVKASQVYGIDDLKEKALSFFSKRVPIIPDYPLLEIVKQFSDFDICDVLVSQDELVRRLAKLLANADSRPKKNHIFDSISPLLLAKILKTSSLAQDKKIDKAALIDEFYASYTQRQNNGNAPLVLTDQERKEFESVFENPDSIFHNLLLRYKCDWATNATLRKHLSAIISHRRDSINNFSTEVGNIADNIQTSRWYAFSNISRVAIRPSEACTSSFNIVKSINTLDGFLDAKNAIRPVKYGLLNVEASPELCPQFANEKGLLNVNASPGLSPQVANEKEVTLPPKLFYQKLDSEFSPEGAIYLNDKKYYLSNQPEKSDSELYYTLDLGKNSKFQVDNLEIESNLPRFREKRRQFPDTVKIQGINSENKVLEPVTKKFDDEGKCIIQLQFNSPISQIKVSMVGEERNGGNLLRIKYIDVKGHFKY